MSSASDLLASVTRKLPGGGESRPGQQKMAEAVAETIAHDGTLLVEAGTGTGKSLAYLTPIAAAGSRAVVATATIALQSQLVEHDIGQVAEGLGRPLRAKLLKGRRNYLCLQRLAELRRATEAEQLDLLGRGRSKAEEVEAIAEWAEHSATGDKEELDPAPAPEVWAALSVGADECPGANRCPKGDECFSEQARRDAYEANVIVTNHHYYGIHLASGGVLLPEHDVVVFDEAHQLPEILQATCGTELSGLRYRGLARRVRGILTDDDLPTRLDKVAAELDGQFAPHVGQGVEIGPELMTTLVSARDWAEQVMNDMRKLDPPEESDVEARIERATLVVTNLINDIDSIIEADAYDVLWVDGTASSPVLRRTPLDVGQILTEGLWGERAAVLTSATLADRIPSQLGLDPATEVLRVGSPFEYERQGLLYCAAHLPNPRTPQHRPAVQEEIAALANAAGGRTLALFTSSSAMHEAATALDGRLPGPILVQGDAAREVLVQRLRDERGAVLFATLSFWQGVDLPGDALTLVTIDRLPFPRPDEPVTQARREHAGPTAFRDVDLPRAQTLLAQATGRLIRSSTDEGVVAVLDPRLASSKAYRWDLVNALPPLRRTKDRAEAETLLRAIDSRARANS